MPYKSNAELPDGVKKALPAAAQTMFRKVFNAAIKQYGNEEQAMKVAWGAVKKSYKKTGDTWTKKEANRDWHLIEYVAPIHIIEAVGGLKSSDDSLSISGVAINETITRNNVRYTAEELEKSATGLSNKPILKDHRNEVDAIVGRTRDSFFDKESKAIRFNGLIMDKKAKEMIADGRITNVSIGARVSDLIEDESDDEGQVMVAKGLEFLELSLTPVPGDAHATIAQALSEAYKLKNESIEDDEDDDEELDESAKTGKKINDLKLKEVEKMEADKIKEDYEAKIKEFETKLAEKEKLITEIKDAEKASLVENYKKLVTSKKAKLREDVDKLSKEAILALIETLESIEIPSVEAKVEKEKVEMKSVVIDEEKTKDNTHGLVVERVGYGKDSFCIMPNSKGEYVIEEVK